MTRAGAGGDGDAFAARLARIGGDGVDLARAAGGEHDGAGGQDEPRRQDVMRRGGKLDARDAAVAQHEIAGGEAFEHGDRRRAPHRLDQRLHDGAAGRVALDVQDAVAAMRRLAAQAEMAFEVLVEGHAVGEQVLDPVARLARQQLRDLLIDDAGAGANRVGGMLLGRCRPRRSRRRCRPAPRGSMRLRRERADTTVTGSGASLSAVNSPASPAPTTTTPPFAC